MLNILRKSAGSWLAKGLFGLLILSFGIWGIGDVVRGGGGNNVAIKVGDVEISPFAVRQQFDRKVNQMRQMLGDQMTVEFARQAGVMDGTIRDMIGSATMDMAAHDLGITISEEGLKEEIASTPAFKDENGVFSASRFHALLAQNGYTEARYVAELRQDLVRARLVDVLTAGIATPDAMASTLYRYTQQQRISESLSIHAAAIAVDGTPTDADLQAIYDGASADFMAPEYRSIVAVLVPQEEVAKRLTISDQDIADHYQANQDTYVTPEKRVVRQVIAQDKATIDAVAVALAGGKSLDDAAEAAKASAPIAIGAVSHEGLPAEMADAVFALQPGQSSTPLQSPLGWHIFEVTGIEPSFQQPLDTVKDSIAQALRNERAVDELYKESADLEDMLGGGATLEEAAAKMNLPLISLSQVDVDGKGKDGTVPPALPAGDAGSKILEAGFATALNEESRLQTYDGGYVIARTDALEAPAPRSMESVRDELVSRWTAQKQDEMAATMATELTAKINEGATLESLVADPVVTYAKHAAVTRDGQSAPQADQALPKLSRPMVARLFSMKATDVVAAKSADGQQIVRLTSVINANPQDNPEAVASLRETLSRAIGDDMMIEATNALSSRFGVTVNQGAIDATF